MVSGFSVDVKSCHTNVWQVNPMSIMASLWKLSICVYIFIYLVPIQSAKILGVPALGSSHYMDMKHILKELAARDHEVTILVSSAEKFKQSPIVTHFVINVPFGKDFMEKAFASALIDNGLASLLLSDNNPATILCKFCDIILGNETIMSYLKDFDLIVSDTGNPCGALLADSLNIPRVDYCPAIPRNPFLIMPYDLFFTVSYVPQMASYNPSGMSFLQRVKNTLVHLAAKPGRLIIFYNPFKTLKTKYNIAPEKSFFDCLGNQELTLFLADHAFDYAQPLPPDFKFVGPVAIQPVIPLPDELQQFIDSSGDDGVVMVSYGSIVSAVLGDKRVDILAEAFGRLKQKVIWRLQGYIPASLSPNIKIVDWLPQNDLLANKKLRAFVSHCGLNSVYETMYHGVPVVAMPLFGDQFDNAIQLEDKGVALFIDYKTLTAEYMYSTIQRVVNEPRFQMNAQRISRLMQDRPRTPVQEAGDWIEYTLRHGSLAHLRPYSSQLPWYQYFLVDVAVFLVLVFLVVIMVIKYTVRLMCWMCCRRTGKQKTQ